jgi:murein DD-endopeptidase MepM/ murein hydrolase activator NlpD
MLMNPAAKVLWVGRASSIVFVLPLVVALVLALPSCSNEKQAQNDASATNKSAQSSPKQPEQGAQVHVTAEGAEVQLTIATAEAGEGAQEPTPVVGDVLYAPIPFAGSDGRTHLVYELEATNFSSGKVSIGKLEVLDADTGDVVTTLDAKEVAGRLQPVGLREPVDTLTPSMTALVFLHLIFDKADKVPNRLVHQLSLKAAAAPPDQQQITEEVGPTEVDRRNVVVIGPPLKGSNYLAADSCCDATRHTRAALPINGQIWLAQRYAVDYEQLDADNRLYSGKKKKLDSYTIYGQEAIAVADGTVVKVVDGLPEQKPGVFPENITPEEADGNSVILDIGGGNYANYAHFQPGSIRVKEGERVKRGDVLGLVGNSGNSLAPHLHFHVMDGSLFLASNGLPYEVDSFTVTGRNTAGTEAFDEAEANGTPLEVKPVDPAKKVTDAMPLDQRVVSFD